MLLALELSLKEKIEKQYEEWMACCPNKKSEIDAWIKSADEDEAVCMKYPHYDGEAGSCKSAGIAVLLFPARGEKRMGTLPCTGSKAQGRKDRV